MKRSATALTRSFAALLICFVAALMTGCAGDQGPVGPEGPAGTGLSDRQIRLSFLSVGGGIAASDTVGYIDPQFYSLIKFDKRNYPGVDSIVVVSQMPSDDAATRCLVDLVNVTETNPELAPFGVPIAGTLLETTSKNWVWVESANIYSLLPEREVTLAVRIRSEKPGVRVSAIQTFLFLYR